MKESRWHLFSFVLSLTLLGLSLSACGGKAEPAPTEVPNAVPKPAPTQTVIPRPTPPLVPGLTWDMLKNTAYPSGWPKNKIAPLVDGVYVEEYVPGAASKLEISLGAMCTEGDLNSDGIDDAAVIIITRPGGSGTFYDLVAVLNQDGRPHPVATAFLGDRIIMRSLAIESGHVVLEMLTQGPNDPMC